MEKIKMIYPTFKDIKLFMCGVAIKMTKLSGT